MVEFIEAALALVGFMALVVVAGLAFSVWFDENASDEQDPYREGLDASARISALAFEAQRLMHQAAEESREDDDS